MRRLFWFFLYVVRFVFILVFKCLTAIRLWGGAWEWSIYNALEWNQPLSVFQIQICIYFPVCLFATFSWFWGVWLWPTELQTWHKSWTLFCINKGRGTFVRVCRTTKMGFHKDPTQIIPATFLLLLYLPAAVVTWLLESYVQTNKSTQRACSFVYITESIHYREYAFTWLQVMNYSHLNNKNEKYYLSGDHQLKAPWDRKGCRHRRTVFTSGPCSDICLLSACGFQCYDVKAWRALFKHLLSEKSGQCRL